MATHIWTKPQTQDTIKKLREAGYIVDKLPSGRYECKNGEEKLFSALPGSRGYLIWYKEGLFTVETKTVSAA